VQSKHGRTTSSASSAARRRRRLPSTCGVKSSRRRNASFSYSATLTSTRKSHPMPTSMGNTTTAMNLSSPLAWSLPSTTSSAQTHIRRALQKRFCAWDLLRALPGVEDVDGQHARNQDIRNFFFTSTSTSPTRRSPQQAAVAAAKNLAEAPKWKFPHYLQESPLAELTRLSRIFSHASGDPETDLTPYSPVAPEPETLGDPAPRRSPRLATHVNRDG
jgi:hypothetical protein